MSIQEQINIDIIKSMKNKDSKKLDALRAAKSALLLECSKDGSNNMMVRYDYGTSGCGYPLIY